MSQPLLGALRQLFVNVPARRGMSFDPRSRVLIQDAQTGELHSISISELSHSLELASRQRRLEDQADFSRLYMDMVRQLEDVHIEKSEGHDRPLFWWWTHNGRKQ